MQKINHEILNLIFNEFIRIIAEEKFEIAFEVYGTNKPLLYYSHPNLNKDKKNWIRRKRNVVDTFSKSSLEIAQKNNYEITSFCDKYGYRSADFALVGGSVPILNTHQEIIGILTVSGLKPEDDDRLARSILKQVNSFISNY